MVRLVMQLPAFALQAWRRSRRAATVVLFSADQGAEQLCVAQQVHIADVLLADVGMLLIEPKEVETEKELER